MGIRRANVERAWYSPPQCVFAKIPYLCMEYAWNATGRKEQAAKALKPRVSLRVLGPSPKINYDEGLSNAADSLHADSSDDH